MLTDSPADKIVLITGAARRIGRALSLSFAAQGWHIAAHYHRSEEDAYVLKADIEALGQKCFLIKADLSEEQETNRLLPGVSAAIGAPHVLINNASLFEYDSVETATFDSWTAHLTINLRAPFLLSQAFAKYAQGQDGEGVILNILDQRVWNLTPHYLSYTLSKSALWTLTQTLAMALAPRIRVNGIGPGPTLQSHNQTAAHFADQTQQIPLKKAVCVSDICKAAHFLVNNTSVTGQMIAVDGGQHLGWSFPGVSCGSHD